MSMTDSQLARAVDMRDAALIDAMYENEELIERQLEHFEEQVKLGNTCEFRYLTEELQADAEAHAIKVKGQAEAKAVADEMDQQAVENPQEIAKPEPTEPLEDFVITIRLNQTTQAQAVATARGLKERFGDCVSLNKAK